MSRYETAALDKGSAIKPPTISSAKRFYYSIVQEVEDIYRMIANHAVDLAVAELRISAPRVFFISQTVKQCADLTESEDIEGSAAWGGREIYIRKGLKPRHLVKICFHEVRHAQQWQRKLRLNHQLAERDAWIWAEEMLIAIGDPADHQVLEVLFNFKGNGR